MQVSPVAHAATATKEIFTLSHTLHCNVSIAQALFSACSSSTLYVCDECIIQAVNISTYDVMFTLEGHTEWVCALAECRWDERTLLLSASNDNSLKVWDVEARVCLATISCVLGSVYELLLLPIGKELIAFCACQDTSLRRINISALLTMREEKNLEQPEEKVTTELVVKMGKMGSLFTSRSAHNGYVYCLAHASDKLFSGSGDSFVVGWSKDLNTLPDMKGEHKGRVNALAADEFYLFSASQDGSVKIWEIENMCLVHTLTGHREEVLSVQSSNHLLFSASADGEVRVWQKDTYRCVQVLRPSSKGGALTRIVSNQAGDMVVIVCDGIAEVWRKAAEIQFSHPNQSENGSADDDVAEMKQVCQFLPTLESFVAIPSVSSDDDKRFHCWNAARFLVNLLSGWGLTTSLTVGKEGRNPVLIARALASTQSTLSRSPSLAGGDPDGASTRSTSLGSSSSPAFPSKSLSSSGLSGESRKCPTVTVYGHYDVVSVKEECWDSPPFQVTGKDGYLYGRGVTDNKGPVLAMMFAVKELIDEGRLPVHVNFLIEGEEECDSQGFREVIQQNLADLRSTNALLVCNDQWIAEDTPCLLFGMRGVVHMEVSVRGANRDLHSGINGGILHEPMVDLVHVLSSLVESNGRVLVPGFYDDVRPVSDAEKEIYDQINFDMSEYEKSLGVKGFTSVEARHFLMRRWRFPTLSVHTVRTVESSDTVIPCIATGIVSVRTVPDMCYKKIVDLITQHVNSHFKRMLSSNTVKVEVKRTGDWWLGDVESPLYEAATAAVKDVWGVSPLLARSGGTIPTTSYLESVLECNAVHLPLGQSSDNQHLPNERIKVENLLKGKEVVKNFLVNFAASQLSPVQSSAGTGHPSSSSALGKSTASNPPSSSPSSSSSSSISNSDGDPVRYTSAFASYLG